MEPHDLLLSGLGAGREKDLDFAKAAAKLGVVDHQLLLERVKAVQTTKEHAVLIASRVARLF